LRRVNALIFAEKAATFLNLPERSGKTARGLEVAIFTRCRVSSSRAPKQAAFRKDSS
jgi:hypothetical protein